MIKSFDGGKHWTQPQEILSMNDACYFVDRISRRCTADGIAGARIDLAAGPSVDIANGAPTGAGATDEIVDAWIDGRFGRVRGVHGPRCAVPGDHGQPQALARCPADGPDRSWR